MFGPTVGGRVPISGGALQACADVFCALAPSRWPQQGPQNTVADGIAKRSPDKPPRQARAQAQAQCQRSKCTTDSQ
eukprot:13630390-Alexandrium_andersonii.AAC.1